MKKIILVINQDKVDLLEELGFSSCGTRDVGGKIASQFVLTEKLFKVINDRSKFSKRDYVEDSKMTF